MNNIISWTAEDEAIIATNTDATECKRCAVELGYWKDDYIVYFAKHVDRKAPEINRGYYARVKAMEMFIHQFLERCGTKCQIINLGCGFDTLYWKLKDTTQAVGNFIELDFPSVVAKKSHIIKRNKQLLEKISNEDGEVMIRSGDLHSDGYHLLSCDLRCLSEVVRKLEAGGAGGAGGGQERVVRAFAELARNLQRMRPCVRPAMCKPYGKQSEQLQKILLDTIQLVQSLRSYLPPPHIQVTSWKNDDKLRSNNMEELESRKIVSGN